MLSEKKEGPPPKKTQTKQTLTRVHDHPWGSCPPSWIDALGCFEEETEQHQDQRPEELCTCFGKATRAPDMSQWHGNINTVQMASGRAWVRGRHHQQSSISVDNNDSCKFLGSVGTQRVNRGPGGQGTYGHMEEVLQSPWALPWGVGRWMLLRVCHHGGKNVPSLLLLQVQCF